MDFFLRRDKKKAHLPTYTLLIIYGSHTPQVYGLFQPQKPQKALNPQYIKGI